METVNRLMQMDQAHGSSPYDEEAFMPMPSQSAAPVNRFLANRLVGRTTPQMMEYMHGGYPSYAGSNTPGMGMQRGNSSPTVQGGDADMMAIYGPDDQVSFDGQGNPIPLASPNHPNNLRMQQSGPSIYPQGRR